MNSLPELKNALSKPEAILFDWDGTLVDTFPLLFRAYNYAREALGLSVWSEQEARQNIRRSARESFPEVFGDKVDEATDLFYGIVRDEHLKELQVMENAKQLLQTIKSHNVHMGVVSNKTHDILITEIGHLGWGSYFESIIGAGRAEKDKPAAAPINLATSEMGLLCEPSAIWYVGDTSLDMECAKNAGVNGIFISHGFGDESDANTKGVSERVSNLNELREIIDLFF